VTARPVHCQTVSRGSARTRSRLTISIITSLPDSSELSRSPSRSGANVQRNLRRSSAVRSASSAAIFFQTDVKREGTWVDKAYLVQREPRAQAAHSSGTRSSAARRPAPRRSAARRSAHLLCFSRELRLEPKHSTADVLPRLGEMMWARAMGVEACVAACQFLAKHAG